MSDFKKNCVELSEDELDQVAGGYSDSHWLAMTPDERVAAYLDSQAKRKSHEYCAYDDPNA